MSALLLLRAVTAASLLAVLHALRVERTADDLVADTGEVLHTTAAHEHDRVLLEVVADTRDVRRDLDAARQAHPGDLAERGVRLLGSGRVDTRAHTTPLGGSLQSGRLVLRHLVLAALADQLVDGGHRVRLFSCPVMLSRGSGGAGPGCAGLGGSPPAVGCVAHRRSSPHRRRGPSDERCECSRAFPGTGQVTDQPCRARAWPGCPRHRDKDYRLAGTRSKRATVADPRLDPPVYRPSPRRSGTAPASSSARCSERTSARSASWVRQENPSASTTV